VLESVLALAVLLLGIREWRTRSCLDGTSRSPLLALTAGSVVVLSVLSYPLFVSVLSDAVPRWPGILCIEGVRQIGTGSKGAAGHLPLLVSLVEGTKLLVLFTAGTWLIFRRSETAGAARRGLSAALLGFLALSDAGLGLVYVSVEKAEIPPTTGCCRAVLAADGREAAAAPEGTERGSVPAGLAYGFLLLTTGLGAGAAGLRRRTADGGSGFAVLTALAVAAGVSLFLAIPFLQHVVAPLVLQLPFHHCAWCVLGGAPETLAGAVMYLGAVLCAGWAPLARLGKSDADHGRDPSRRILGAAMFGFFATAAMATSVLVMA
jgi:hypothetical protein